MASSNTLREAAARAARNAYAPYSGLRVGAALRSSSGQVHCGCNVENGSLSIGGCAERAAIAAAVVAEGAAIKLEAMAIVATSSDGAALAVSPCGACRQALVEFGPGALIGFLGADGRWTVTTAAELLPHVFVLPPS